MKQKHALSEYKIGYWISMIAIIFTLILSLTTKTGQSTVIQDRCWLIESVCDCSGKITSLTFVADSNFSSSHLIINTGRGNNRKNYSKIFDGNVEPNDTITVTNPNSKNNKFGSETEFLINNDSLFIVHTSCSEPIIGVSEYGLTMVGYTEGDDICRGQDTSFYVKTIYDGVTLNLYEDNVLIKQWANNNNITHKLTKYYKLSVLEVGCGLVPVVLSQYEINANILHLTTSSEKNNSHFEVQYYQEGSITTGEIVQGKGTSLISNYYPIKLNPPNPHQPFYIRVKQVDFDGQYEYFNWLFSPSIDNRIQDDKILYDIIGRQLNR